MKCSPQARHLAVRALLAKSCKPCIAEIVVKERGDKCVSGNLLFQEFEQGPIVFRIYGNLGQLMLFGASH